MTSPHNDADRPKAADDNCAPTRKSWHNDTAAPETGWPSVPDPRELARDELVDEVFALRAAVAAHRQSLSMMIHRADVAAGELADAQRRAGRAETALAALRGSRHLPDTMAKVRHWSPNSQYVDGDIAQIRYYGPGQLHHARRFAAEQSERNRLVELLVAPLGKWRLAEW